MTTPTVEFNGDFSEPGAPAVPWADVERVLTTSEMFFLSTVRADGRPHVTPLIGVWSEGALHFCTGPSERKARNLAANPEVVLTTGANTLREGCDVVVEGRATRVTDEQRLIALAEAWEAKYGAEWHFGVTDGLFSNGAGGRAEVFAVAPRTAFGFAKGDPYGQTRWRFA